MTHARFTKILLLLKHEIPHKKIVFRLKFTFMLNTNMN